MFGIGRSAISIYRELSRRALSVASVQEVGDSNIKKITQKNFHPSENEGETPKAFFRRNVGKMSDGLHVEMLDAERDSYNILTSIVLSSKEHGEISRSHNRFGNNIDSAFIYINGLKIPDSCVHMYTTKSHTNFIIAKKYFNQDSENLIFIEKRRFDNYSYGGTYVENFNSFQIEFPISQHRNLIINNDTIMIFNNGELLNKNQIGNIIYQNGIVNINFLNILQGSLEVFIDSSIKFVKYKPLYINNKNISSFSIDSDFIDPLYGPINRDNSLFFINGKRINNIEIEQKGRLHYHLNRKPEEEDISTIIFTDNGVIDIKSFKLYGDDYFLYNFLSDDNMTKALIGEKTDTTFDTGIDFKSIVSERYTKDNVIDILFELEKIQNVELRIQKLLKKCPYLLKPFLECFASMPVIKNKYYNGIDEFVNVGLNVDYELGSKIIRVIIVNGVVAKVSEFFVTTITRYWRDSVDSKYFTPETDNEIHIYESVFNDYKPYKVVEVNRYETTDFIDNVTGKTYYYRAIADVFSNIKSIDDFVILAITKREFDPDGIYLDDTQYGFRIVDSPRIIIDNKIFISFGGNDPRIDMLIIMPKIHHYQTNFHVNIFDKSYESIFNNISCGIEKFFDNNEVHEVKIPLIHDGNVIAINETSGSLLFNNVDYIYRTPYNTESLRKSGVIMKRKLEENTSIRLVFLPEYNSTDGYISMSKEDTGPNKYALLYLGGLRFPFSPKYIKTYANNKIILSKDIDILSNKLIRLYNIKTVCTLHEGSEDESCPKCLNGGSLQNVYIDYSFKVSFNNLEPFIIDYEDYQSDLDDKLSKIFNVYNIHNSFTGGIGHVTANNIYKNQFDINVDSNNKTPNEIVKNKSFITSRYDLYMDAYLRWFISIHNKSIFKSYENIPEEVLRELEIFRDNTYGDSYDVIIRPEQNVLMSDIEVSTKPEFYPGFYHGETIKNFLECCIENNMSIQEGFERYTEFVNSNIVFKRDLLPISAIKTFEGEDIVIGRGEIYKGE